MNINRLAKGWDTKEENIMKQNLEFGSRIESENKHYRMSNLTPFLYN